MHARFREHVYHRHHHDTYSFGVTESGAQSFTCRGAAHTSAAGMVMAFNPDDPHDGHATTGQGFSYRMIHIGPGLVADVLADIGGRPAGWPLFAAPVVADPELAAALGRLHRALTGPATPLERGERLTIAAGPGGPGRGGTACRRRPGQRGRDRTHRPAGPGPARRGLRRAGLRRRPGDRRRVQPLRRVPGLPSVAGLAPGEYQRQLRLRAARRALAPGDAARAGRRRGGLRRPGPPDPVVPPLLRHYARRLRPRRPLTCPGPLPWACRCRGRWG